MIDVAGVMPSFNRLISCIDFLRTVHGGAITHAKIVSRNDNEKWIGFRYFIHDGWKHSPKELVNEVVYSTSVITLKCVDICFYNIYSCYTRKENKSIS